MTASDTNVPGPTIAAAEALNEDTRLPFDFESAREAGASTQSIAKFLSEQAGVDYLEQQLAGKSDDEIIEELSISRRPSVPERIIEGGFRGIVKGLPMAGMGATGVAVGAPFGPGGMLLGGTLGTLAGLYAGSEAEKGFENIGLLSDVPLTPGSRPLAEGAETFFSGVPLTKLPLWYASRMPLGTGRFLERQAEGTVVPRSTPLEGILRTAQTQPGMFAAGETGALFGAGVGATLAEQSRPGDEFTRMAAEITLGMANPVAIVSRFGQPARTAIGRFINNLTTTGRQNTIARRLYEILENAGEDPEAVIRALDTDDEIAQLAREYGVDLGPRTAAQVSGSPTLAKLQRTIAEQNNRQAGPTLARAAERNIEGISRLIGLMSQIDDPAILSTVAQMRDQFFRDTLQMRLDQASARAAETAGRLLDDDPLAGQRAGQTVANIVGEALTDAREQERALYNAVDLTELAGASTILDTVNQIRGNRSSVLLGQDAIPSSITRIMDRLSEEGAEITLRDLVNFRSSMLDKARTAQANSEFADANAFGRLAEAALEDIGLRATARPGGIDPTIPMMRSSNQRALQNAYEFSRALNDVFTRGFAGQVGARARSGARRIPPELLARRIFSGGGDLTSLRLAQLDEAAEFLVSRGSPEFAEEARDRLGTLRGAEAIILRSQAADKLNPETGAVNTVSLSRFIRNNAAALQNFHQLRRDLENAVTAQQVLRDVQDSTSAFSRGMDDNRVFNYLLGEDENPGGAVALAIGTPGEGRAPNAVRNLNQLIRLANLAGDNLAPAARRGLRDAVMDRARVYATDANGNFNFTRYRRFLTEPMSEGQPSVVNVLRDGGIFTDGEAVNLSALLREFDNIQQLLDTGGPQLAERIVDVPSVALQGFIRMVGAGAGTGVGERLSNIRLPIFGRILGPQSLVAGGVGSQVFQNMFGRMPEMYFNDMVLNAVSDPKVMEDFLRKGSELTANQQARIGRRMNAFLVNAGLQPTREEMDENRSLVSDMVLPRPAEAATLDEAAIQEYLNSVQQPAPAPAPVAPPPTPRPAPSQQGALPPAAPLPQTPQAGGQSRASYAALFPNDPISPMVQQREIQQGIGSLMGGR